MTGAPLPNAQVLKNRGVPVILHVLAGDDEPGGPARPYKRTFTSDDESAEPILCTRWVQFTNSVIADIEDTEMGWGDQDGWQDALSKQPFLTLCKTLAISFEWWVPEQVNATGGPVPDQRRAGKAMLDGQIDTYATALGGAYSLSQGVTPEQAGEIMRAGIKSAAELRPLIASEVEKMIAEEEAAIQRARGALATPTSPDESTPSDSNSDSGSVPAVPSTSSGG